MGTVCVVIEHYSEANEFEIIDHYDRIVAVAGNPTIAENVIEQCMMDAKNGYNLEFCNVKNITTDNIREYGLEFDFENVLLTCTHLWEMIDYEILES